MERNSESSADFISITPEGYSTLFSDPETAESLLAQAKEELVPSPIAQTETPPASQEDKVEVIVQRYNGAKDIYLVRRLPE